MKRIPLGRSGKFALVSDIDYPYVRKYSWHLSIAGYVERAWRRRGRSPGHRYLHRTVKPSPKGKLTDHRNLNKLDCRRSNLRFVDWSQNGANRGPNKNNSSGYKGVY